jgi:hypothetical protein
MRKTTMFRVQLFGRDSVGHSIQRELGANFPSFEPAIDAAEATAAVSGSMTSYRITDVRGKFCSMSGCMAAAGASHI